MSSQILEFGYDPIFRKGILLLGVPFCYLGEALLSEEVVKNLGFPTVRREEEKKILYVSTFEGRSKVIHRLISQVGAEYDGENGDRCVWVVWSRSQFGNGRKNEVQTVFDELILCETL